MGLPSDAVAVAAGGYHSIVLMADGSVWTTGRNDHGQLGDGSTDYTSTFKRVTGTWGWGSGWGEGESVR